MSPKQTRTQQHRALLYQARKRYDELAAKQGGETCGICGTPPKSRRLHIDHDHARMKIRGLLCFRCNNALPSWVTPGWLRDAAAYLESPGLEEAA